MGKDAKLDSIKEEDIIAATETDGGIGEEIEVAEVELVEDGDVNE